MIQGKYTAVSDPRVYKETMPGKLAGYKRILGMDLGTNCGIAFTEFQPGKPLKDLVTYLDLLDLSIGAWDSGAARIIRLQQFLSIIRPDMIAFEDVKYTPSQGEMFGGKIGAIVARVANASELIGALKVTVCTWAERRGIPCEGFGIGEIKKHATGRGNASKAEMVAACNRIYGTSFDPETCQDDKTDNIADAVFVHQIMLDRYGEAGAGERAEPKQVKEKPKIKKTLKKTPADKAPSQGGARVKRAARRSLRKT